MVTDQLQQLRDALAAGPTDGPWSVLEHLWSDTSIIAPGFDHGICCLDINHATEESQDADGALMAANAAYIAAANPATIRALLARLDAAEADAKRLREFYEADTAVKNVYDEVSPGLSSVPDGHYGRLTLAVERLHEARAALKGA